MTAAHETRRYRTVMVPFHFDACADTPLMEAEDGPLVGVILGALHQKGCMEAINEGGTWCIVHMGYGPDVEPIDFAPRVIDASNAADVLSNAESNARAWLSEMVEHHAAWMQGTTSGATDGGEDHDTWAIESALSVETRGAWRSLGAPDDGPAEYVITLTTGGPALRIRGGLNQYGEPGDTTERLALQWQDWGTPWTDCPLTETERDAVAWFASRFYFGE